MSNDLKARLEAEAGKLENTSLPLFREARNRIVVLERECDEAQAYARQVSDGALSCVQDSAQKRDQYGANTDAQRRRAEAAEAECERLRAALTYEVNRLAASLRRLSYAAQTTGGTAGPDRDLQGAIKQGEWALGCSDTTLAAFAADQQADPSVCAENAHTGEAADQQGERAPWTADDIKVGLVVRRDNGADERWMVGYRYSALSHFKRYTLVSLSDGMEAVYGLKSDVASHMNEAWLVRADWQSECGDETAHDSSYYAGWNAALAEATNWGNGLTSELRGQQREAFANGNDRYGNECWHARSWLRTYVDYLHSLKRDTTP